MNKWKLIILMLCCSMIGVCGKYTFDYFQAFYTNKQVYGFIVDIGFPENNTDQHEDDSEDETEKETEASDFDYDSLLAINNDCIGWIRIDGTDIDYPVVQAADNSFYLHHNFNQESAICGAIFVDYRNDIDLSKAHPEITLYLRNQKHNYDVVAVYVTNIAKGGGYYNYLHGNTREEQIEYLQNKMAAYQLYDTGLTVT